MGEMQKISDCVLNTVLKRQSEKTYVPLLEMGSYFFRYSDQSLSEAITFQTAELRRAPSIGATMNSQI